MKIFAPAKVNLMLHITGRRPDGYHTLQSAIAFADVGDVLEILPTDHFTFEVTGPFAAHAPAGDDNLVVRAVRAMEQAAGRKFDAAATLTKNIPAGAGLGGGSADAAAMLRGINDAWGQGLSTEALRDIALTLGADVPVCLQTQAQWVEGVGEALTSVSLQQSFHSVLIWPGQGLSTQTMFRAYRDADMPFSHVMIKPDILTLSDLSAGRNDFLIAAVSALPVLRNILDDLQVQDGCIFARLSGSGSACFGIFASAADAKKAALVMAAAYPAAWVAPSILA